MTENRRFQVQEDFKRQSNNRTSRSKQQKHKLHHIRSKQMFLTDTQTSDHTKSSCEVNVNTNLQLPQLVRKLKKQNQQLKKAIIQLRSNQFFKINEQKLKSIIVQNQKLRNDVLMIREKLQQSLIQRDFLQRFNKNLKTQCQALTKQLISKSKQQQHKKIQRFPIDYYQDQLKPKNIRKPQFDDKNSKKIKQPSSRTKQQEKTDRLLKKSRSTSRLNGQYLALKNPNQYFVPKSPRQGRGKRGGF